MSLAEGFVAESKYTKNRNLLASKMEEKMTKTIKFLNDDAGVLAIDWVAVITGVLMFGIIIVYFAFDNGYSGSVDAINTVNGIFNIEDINSLPGGNTGESIVTAVADVDRPQ